MGKKDDINVLIIGHSEHGKSDVAKALCKHFGWTEGESSYVCKEIVFEELIKRGYNYSTPQEAWEDRRNNKQVWKEIIKDYNSGDLARLTKKIFTDNELYVGLRDGEEFTTAYMSGEFDVIVYVDAWDRKPNFDVNNLDIPRGMADVVIDNNKGLEELKEEIDVLIEYLQGYLDFKNESVDTGNEIRYTRLWDRISSTCFSVLVPNTEERDDATVWLLDTAERLFK